MLDRLGFLDGPSRQGFRCRRKRICVHDAIKSARTQRLRCGAGHANGFEDSLGVRRLEDAVAHTTPL